MAERIELSKDYTINRVINGCWQLSEGHTIQGSLDFSDVMHAFHELAEQGFTTFDCGDIYTGVEEFLGKFILELKNGNGISPNDIQIHTKYVPDIDMLSRVNMEHTEGIIDRSLKRLNKDVLDMVQFHWWDYNVPGMIETAQNLQRLQEKGKIRNVSVTNFNTKNLKALVDAGVKICSSQSQYSLLDRRPEKEYLDFCKANGIHLLCYGTLSGGFLSDRWIGKAYEQPETRSQVKYMQIIEDSTEWEGYQKLLLLLKEIADGHHVSVSNVATRFILEQEGVAAGIVGVRNSKHVKDNAKTLAFHLAEDEKAAIRSFLNQYPIPDGDCFDLERTPGTKYMSILWMNLNEEQ